MFKTYLPTIKRSSLLKQMFYFIAVLLLFSLTYDSSAQTEQQCQPPKDLPLLNDAPTENIWQGKSGDYDILWTTDDITAGNEKTKKTVFSVRTFALDKTIEELGKPAKWYCNSEDYSRSYRILSLVGNLMSLEETTISSPQTYLTIKYRTVDLSGKNQMPLLTDYFPAREVFKELSKDELIQLAIKGRGEELYGAKSRKFVPKNLDEFFKFFECSAAEKKDGQTSCGQVSFTSDEYSTVYDTYNAHNISIEKNLLNGFAFEITENGKVTVELLIPALTGNRNEEGFSVTLNFRISSLLKNALLKADSHQNGFLMEDKNLIWKKAEDEFYLSTNVTLASNRSEDSLQ